MILIADSGSTKTDWCLADDKQVVGRWTTTGINPVHQTDEQIEQTVDSLIDSIEKIVGIEAISAIAFYGAGCTPAQQPRMRNLLLKRLKSVAVCEVAGDMLGAARAVCGSSEGIACILGTGANSCLYDGRMMVQNTPPLGYILGDEGSGAVLGRLFINALYKGRLPQSLREDFEREAGLTMGDVIDRVYRQPLANRFLASTSLFISRHLDVEPLRQLVIGNFRQFFRLNVVPYGRTDLPVGFVGSMAFHYEQELREAAAQEGFKVGTVVKSPMEGLLAYHVNAVNV